MILLLKNELIHLGFQSRSKEVIPQILLAINYLIPGLVHPPKLSLE